MKKRVLVTEGAGFLGSHLCTKLLSEDCEILCIDNFFTGTRRKVEALLDEPHLHWNPGVSLQDGLKRTINYFDTLLSNLQETKKLLWKVAV